MSKTKIENMDDYMFESDKIKAININPLAPQWQFRMIISGASGSGKTNLLLNLITKDFLYFDKIYIYAKDLSEDKFQFVLKFFTELAEVKHKKLISKAKNKKEKEELKNTEFKILEVFSESIDDLPEINSLDKSLQHLFIFDDMILENKKIQMHIAEFYIRARKRNASCIYLTQQYHDVIPQIRKNVNYIAIFNVVDKKELQELAKNHAVGMEYKEFLKMFNQIMKNNSRNFLLIDRKTTDPKMVYRENFEPIDE